MKKAIFLQVILGLFFMPILHAAFVNDQAPDFKLTSLEGPIKSLSDYAGKVVFINFWASWCPPCKKEFPELNKLAEEYKDKDFVMVAINLDKSQKSTQKFLEKIGQVSEAVEVLLDPDSKVVARYVARSMPSSYIVDQNGVIRSVHFGYSKDDPEKWRAEVDGLLKEAK